MPMGTMYRATPTTPMVRRRTVKRKIPKSRRNEIVRVLNSKLESKYFDVNVQNVNIDNVAGNVYNLTSNIIRGTSFNNYLGKTITPNGCSIYWRISYTGPPVPPPGNDVFNTVRFIIIQMKAASIPNLPGVLTLNGSILSPFGFPNPIANNTYRVLKTWICKVDSLQNYAVEGHLNLKKRMRKIEYSDGVGTLEEGGIYICTISDSAAIPHPILDMSSRIYYKDA